MLYNRYLREKQDVEEVQYAAATQDERTTANARRQLQAAEEVANGLAETALSRGRQGTQDVPEEMQRLAQAKENVVSNAEERRQATRDKLLTTYATQRQRQDAQLDKDVAAAESMYDALWRRNWSRLQTQLKEQLPSFVSQFDDAKYTVEGVNEIKRQLNEHREELGDLYDEAVEWAAGLPVYHGRTDGTVLHTVYGDVFVSDSTLSMAAVVGYEGGGGGSVDKNDIINVSYADVKYRVKAANQVGGRTNAILNALAKNKGMGLNAGSILYYEGQLYVYGGGAWLSTANVAGAGQHSLSALIKRLANA